MRKGIEIPCERCGKPSITLRGGFFCKECIASATPVTPQIDGGEVPDILDCAGYTAIRRYRPIDYCDMPGDMVLATEYDALLEQMQRWITRANALEKRVRRLEAQYGP